MSNLIPEKRLDKNGRLVTKHVRTIAKPSSKTSLPAPALTKAKGFVPLDKQLTPRVTTFSKSVYVPNAAMERAFIGWAEPSYLSYECNDVDAYDVLSVLRPLDALVAIHGGVRSARDAKRIATENGLEYTIVDDSELTEEALRRRIPADAFISMSHLSSKRGRVIPDEQLLDAAETYANPKLQSLGFHQDVLRGDIKLSDIKAVGISTITGHEAVAELRSVLWEIKTGEAPCSAREFKAIIKQAEKADCRVTVPMNMARRYGTEFTLGLHNVDEAHDLCLRMGSDKDHDALSEDTKSFIQYHDQLVRVRSENGTHDNNPGYIDYDAARDMFNAGIDPVTAMDAIDQNMTSVQVLAIRDHDIAPSVSGGWL